MSVGLLFLGMLLRQDTDAMPSLAALHPQIVHFVVALIVVGVAFRCLSLALRTSWLPVVSAVLIALGTAASIVAVRSGQDAHGPVEQVPGARSAVLAHEVWGERARNVFVVLLVFEAVAAAMALRQRPRARTASTAAALVGLVAAGLVVRVGALGGDLVYGYAGGVGVRSGNPADVNRLLIAAAHHQAALDRQSGKLAEAGALTDLVASRFPDHLELQLAQVESLIIDRKNPRAALARLDQMSVPTDDPRMRVRAGLLRASALAAAGEASAGRQVLETLKTEFPTNGEIQRRLAEPSTPPK